MKLGRIGTNRRCCPPGCDVIEGSTVQRSIPPDSTAAGSRQPGISQHEAIGDLHLAADAFANAVEAYKRLDQARKNIKAASGAIDKIETDITNIQKGKKSKESLP